MNSVESIFDASLDMSEDNLNNRHLIDAKSEKHDECHLINGNESEMFIINKDEISSSNCDFEDVDIESINIDDIFNENPSITDWSQPKADYTVVNMTESNPIEISNTACVNNESLTLIQQHQSPLQFDNKYFFIKDILNKEKFYNNDERYSDNNISSLSFVLNNNFVPNTSLINNNFCLIKSEVEVPVSVNATESGLLYGLTEGHIVTKNKAILPLVDLSPNKKNTTIKLAKSYEQLCLVCKDTATGKHYGVVSCEGCKGFFKRTIRNNLSYRCRDFNKCSVDKKLRNRCQACRFQKCLVVGMKSDAVQTEKSEKRSKKSLCENDDNPSASPSLSLTTTRDQSLEKIHSNIVSQISSDNMLQLEIKYNPDVEETGIVRGNAMDIISEVVNDHLFSIVSWAKYVPGFAILSVSDQTLLLKMCWGELVIANFTHRSLKLNADVILLRNGSKLMRDTAAQSGIGQLIDRIIIEILHRFRDLRIDRCELSFIKAIILFNPNLRDLVNRPVVQMIRDKLYRALHTYCTEYYPSETYRFTKLLLRLPSLRSIAHLSLDHFRLYDIVDKSSRVNYTHRHTMTKEGPRIFDFLSEMLQHSDIIFDH